MLSTRCSCEWARQTTPRTGTMAADADAAAAADSLLNFVAVAVGEYLHQRKVCVVGVVGVCLVRGIATN